MPYRLRYHPDVKEKDLPKLNRTIQKRIKTAIEQRLLVEAQKYSQPLRRTLKCYRKPKIGDYQIILQLESEDIWILGICHRKDVYERMEWRIQYFFGLKVRVFRKSVLLSTVVKGFARSKIESKVKVCTKSEEMSRVPAAVAGSINTAVLQTRLKTKK